MDKAQTDAKLFVKPPIGIEPRWKHDGDRIIDILNAMVRYADSGLSVPKEWLIELIDLWYRDDRSLWIEW